MLHTKNITNANHEIHLIECLKQVSNRNARIIHIHILDKKNTHNFILRFIFIF